MNYSELTHSSLRIIAGMYRRRHIHFAFSRLDQKAQQKYNQTIMLRPSGSRVREMLFNWLSYDINGARVLDLFAGSGILGFEALSRGASEVIFIEKQAFYAKQINKNSERLGCQSQMQVINTDAFVWLENNKDTLGQYDIIFIDPPFQQNYYIPVIDVLSKQVSSSTMIYVECDRQQPVSAEYIEKSWQIIKSSTTGNVVSLLLSRF